MARRPRLHYDGAFYHVTLRGNHQQDIFHCDGDRRLLERYVAEALAATRVRIHAYCWMSNHIHLLAQVADVRLGEFMQRVGTRYARAVQARVETTGHLFQGRHFAMLVDADAYFLELLRYIHLNPVRAKVVADPAAYRWSSHRVYLGLDERRWVESEFGLRMFGAEASRARGHYAEFVAQKIGAPRDPSLYAGHEGEPQVLGDAAFVERARAAAESARTSAGTAGRVGRASATDGAAVAVTFGGSPAPRPASLEEIVAAVCRECGVTLKQLLTPSQERALSKARGLIVARAKDTGVASISEVARLLNRSVSAVARAGGRYRR
jgi:REP element-mobilizing transposase RayT